MAKSRNHEEWTRPPPFASDEYVDSRIYSDHQIFEEELDKIAANAPGARVYIRLIVDNPEADWPLSRKFGVPTHRVLPLLAHAQALGLVAHGLSFHVGSQTREPRMWDGTLDQVATVWRDARAEGFDLRLLNIGGGFPAFYGSEIDHPTDYAAAVMARVDVRFPDAAEVMAEPGRGLVAEAGAIAAMVAAWVAGFDVIYALQDVAVDRAQGLFSMPARLGEDTALWISRTLHALSIAALAAAWSLSAHLGSAFAAATAAAAALLVLEHALVWRSRLNHLHTAFFTVNGVISLLLGAAGCLDAALRS